MIKTSLAEFDKMAKSFPLVPVAAEILGDLDTPVTTFLKTTRGRYRFLLESVESETQRGRYSIIGDTPFLIFKAKGRTITIENKVQNSSCTIHDNPLHVLQNIIKKYTVQKSGDTPFYTNGFFGYLGYDAVRHIEDLPNESVDDVDLPDIHMFIPQKIIVFDSYKHTINIIFYAHCSGDVVKTFAKATKKLKDIVSVIRDHSAPNPKGTYAMSKDRIESNLSRNDYEGMVTEAKKHIRRGDAFQIVLSQRLKVPTDVPAFQIYRGLRVVNPSPYMFFMDLDGVELLGSSPETLVKLQDNIVTVKPIAGTRKRGATPEEDRQNIQELLADPKERAEHTMLVDLGRNDVGRIAKYGSVKVDDLMVTEKYSHVIHIVSTVSGELASDMDVMDVFKACFPAGTLTGAPKVKAMEIIERLEPTKRAIYGGAVGYMTFGGDMDVCIAIRTIFKKNGIAYLQAGAGIVADSVPEHEYLETLNKANGLLRAVEYAEGGLI
ncbi:anthranilate synthase component I [candidate division KSB1 bacterium]|nr:anthranilate synthase component I [candidate division KSB1 bacterium]